MVDTLQSVATKTSLNNSKIKIWDKGQIIVITIWTKYAKYTIILGDKNNTIAALRSLPTRITQWADYMEDVLQLITIDLNYEVILENRITNQ